MMVTLSVRLRPRLVESRLNNIEKGEKTEREGFEPSVQLPTHAISSRVPSAARTPLQVCIAKPRCGRVEYGIGFVANVKEASLGRPRYANPTLTGLLVVDKPLGWSSMDIVRRLRRVTGGAKAGHAGTLDPLATGVVICCLGKATKLIDSLMGMTKVYEAGVDLSAFTATDDREGPREEVTVEQPPTREVLLEVLPRFVGEIDQKPPAFSALHIGGERAYKLARRGEVVDMPSRKVRIDAIELMDYAWPIAVLRITCGKGTYIRSLARDIGIALNTGGHLSSLRRTAIGAYTLEGAFNEERLQQPIGEGDLLPLPGNATASSQPVSDGNQSNDSAAH